MMDLALRISCGLCILAPLFASAAETLPGFGDPAETLVPLVRVNPNYPPGALNDMRDGWVLLSLSVNADGTVDGDSVIVLDSSDDQFSRAAVPALKRWTYDAETGGIGARGASFQTIFRFTLEDATTAASSRFTRFYDTVQTLLNEGKLDEAGEALDDTRDDVATLQDDALHHWLGFRYALARGDEFVAADELEKVLVNPHVLASELLVASMDASIALAVAHGEVHRAKDYIQWLRQSDEAKTAAAYATVMQKLETTERALDARLASTEPLAVAGNNIRRYWTHGLTHHEFSVGGVEGEITALQVRCRNAGAQQLGVQIDTGYKLPASWESCAVYIEAEPGTRFTLYEYPPEPSATPPAP